MHVAKAIDFSLVSDSRTYPDTSRPAVVSSIDNRSGSASIHLGNATSNLGAAARDASNSV